MSVNGWKDGWTHIIARSNNETCGVTELGIY